MVAKTISIGLLLYAGLGLALSISERVSQRIPTNKFSKILQVTTIFRPFFVFQAFLFENTRWTKNGPRALCKRAIDGPYMRSTSGSA